MVCNGPVFSIYIFSKGGYFWFKTPPFNEMSRTNCTAILNSSAGPIPSEIGDLTELTYLDLSSNAQWDGRAWVGGLTGTSFV